MNDMPSQALAQLVETRASTFTAFRNGYVFRESRIYERNTGFAISLLNRSHYCTRIKRKTTRRKDKNDRKRNKEWDTENDKKERERKRRKRKGKKGKNKRKTARVSGRYYVDYLGLNRGDAS